jgi:hypothetical protein
VDEPFNRVFDLLINSPRTYKLGEEGAVSLWRLLNSESLLSHLAVLTPFGRQQLCESFPPVMFVMLSVNYSRPRYFHPFEIWIFAQGLKSVRCFVYGILQLFLELQEYSSRVSHRVTVRFGTHSTVSFTDAISRIRDRMLASALNFAAGFWGIPYEHKYLQSITIEDRNVSFRQFCT